MKVLSACFLATIAMVSAQFDGFIGLDNPYIAPGPGDERSPCPAINTIANHGLINRDGKAVSLVDLQNALAGAFPVGQFPQGPINQAIADGLTYDNSGVESIDIIRLEEHNVIEHDSSFVRTDFFFGNTTAQLLPNEDLVTAFLEKNDKDFLTLAEIMETQEERIKDSRRTNPDNEYNSQGLGGMAGQSVLILMFGQDPDLQVVDKKIVRAILRDETFPNDYTNLGPVLIDFTDPTTTSSIVLAEFMASINKAVTGKLKGCCKTCATVQSWLAGASERLFGS